MGLGKSNPCILCLAEESISMSKIILISVVRDKTMYAKCIQNNPYCQNIERILIDNSIENEHISHCYNRFLNSRQKDEDAWYLFCHEDFEIREDLQPHFIHLDKEELWGPIGARTCVRLGIYHQWQLIGSVTECMKDGCNEHAIGTKVKKGELVETFDCQCLIVHSSLVHTYTLRFDDQLSFDLYVEDFCISAKCKYNINSRILPLSVRHWSPGKINPRYYDQEQYISKKYPYACFTGTSSYVLGGKPSFFRKLTVRIKQVIRKFG